MGERLKRRSPITYVMRTGTNIILRLLLRWTVGAISIFSGAALLFLAILPHTGLYRTMTVLSGSMRPAFAAGDLVITTQKPIDQVHVGDVLVYHIPIGDRHVESHRIVQILSRSPQLVVRTKGDANKAIDPWTARLNGSSVWTVRATIPYAGWTIVWLRTPLLHKITLFLAPALVVLLLLQLIWRQREDEPKALPLALSEPE
jgi:signal peptidase